MQRTGNRSIGSIEKKNGKKKRAKAELDGLGYSSGCGASVAIKIYFAGIPMKLDYPGTRKRVADSVATRVAPIPHPTAARRRKSNLFKARIRRAAGLKILLSIFFSSFFFMSSLFSPVFIHPLAISISLVALLFHFLPFGLSDPTGR